MKIEKEEFEREKNYLNKTVSLIRKKISKLGQELYDDDEKVYVRTTEEEVNNFCMALPRYKRPRKIIFADIPRNPTGKIEKPKLRKIFGGEGLVDSQNKS